MTETTTAEPLKITMRDLRPFCSQSDWRRHLSEPFTLGAYTYALDGTVNVRVPRIEGEADTENPDQLAAINTIEKIFATCADQVLAPLPFKMPPELPKVECGECEGRGTDCDCPHCDNDECKCTLCNGDGEVARSRRIIFEHVCIKERLLRRVAGLPGFQLGMPSEPQKADVINALRFTFDDGQGRAGDGLIAPMGSRAFANVSPEYTIIVAELVAEQAAAEAKTEETVAS